MVLPSNYTVQFYEQFMCSLFRFVRKYVNLVRVKLTALLSHMEDVPVVGEIFLMSTLN